MDEKREVIKHSAAIHIQNNITLLQRRAWNVLLYHAYDDLPNEEQHQITTQKLTRLLEYASKNDEYLKESLGALVGCKVEWNVLGKDDKEQWGVTTLLAQALIEDGVCTYAYSPALRDRLYNPRMYARISLSMQNKFNSKYAQTLWELCVDYLDETRGHGTTPFIPLTTYRKLMGITEEMYPKFKKFNERVIKGPVDEINRVTDFRVETDYKRERRKICAVKFRVSRERTLPGQENHQGTLFPELEDMPILVKELKEVGISAQDAWDIWQEQWMVVAEPVRPQAPEDDPETAFTRYIREKIHLLKTQEPGKVKNRTGWLLRAIKQNYSNPAFTEEEAKRTQSQIAHASQMRDRQRKALEEKKERLERERDDAIHAICVPILDERPSLIDDVVQKILQEEPHYKRLYDRHQTALENYQKHQFLTLVVDEQLLKRFPKRFKSLCDYYQTELEQLDQQLAGLVPR